VRHGTGTEEAVVRNFRTTATDGKTYNTRFYNLDAIISVGYRVNSYQATQFRIWATQTLKEFIIKGFVLDDDRLKQGNQVFGKDYFDELIRDTRTTPFNIGRRIELTDFTPEEAAPLSGGFVVEALRADELLERIREIRASDRRFYQKITDIYALSIDYDKDAPLTTDFFATVQNRLHWAITGKTSAEIIYQTADAKKDYMGLTTWKNAPKGKILKSDTVVAKNYLHEKHIKELEQIVSAYLDLAENRAHRQIVMKMTDWVQFLNGFLELSNYPILEDKGKISAEAAKLKAAQEYEVYRGEQDKTHLSDFDNVLKQVAEKEAAENQGKS
jgi:hypothetical protein